MCPKTNRLRNDLTARSYRNAFAVVPAFQGNNLSVGTHRFCTASNRPYKSSLLRRDNTILKNFRVGNRKDTFQSDESLSHSRYDITRANSHPVIPNKLLRKHHRLVQAL